MPSAKKRRAKIVAKVSRSIRRALPMMAALLVTIIWLDVSLLRVPVLQPVLSIPFLLLMPGYFIHRAIVGRTRQSPMRTIVNSVGLSLLAIMLGGLALNQLALAFGDQTPLTEPNLAWVMTGVTVIAIVIAQLRVPLRFKKRLFQKKRPLKAIGIGAALAVPPTLAVGGATTLNNGGSDWLALLALAGAAALLIVGVWQRKRLNALLPFFLYSAALTILLGTSMRGWNITGHDVTQEFQVFEMTLHHRLWNMAFYQDAYTACLSITILPTVLQLLTGLGDQYVFKFIFPLFVALTVPALYLGVRPYVSRKIAFLAAAVFMSFSPFVVDFTMLNRQTTAFLFLLLALMTGLNRRLSRSSRTILTFVFLSGMILSHYSSSYVGLSMLLLTILAGAVVAVFGRLVLRRKIECAFSVFQPSVVIAALMVLLLWNTFATQTSNNIQQTIQGVFKSIPAVFSGKGVTGGAGKVGSSGKALLPAYVASLKATRPLPAADYYPSIPASQEARPADGQIEPVNPVLAHLGVSQSLLGRIYSLAKSIYSMGILALAAIGIVILARSRRSKLPLQYALLGVSGLALVGLQLVVPSSAINYGLLRVVQQTLIVLSLPIIIALIALLKLIKIKEPRALKIGAALMAVVMLLMIGVLASITGGDKPALPLSNSGFYYQAYLTQQTDIAADTWLQTSTPVGSRVYADEFARRQMIAYSGIFAQPTMIPEVVPIDSYVYVSTNDKTFAMVPFYYNGQLDYYAVPYAFLNANKNLVYSSGGVLIYK